MKAPAYRVASHVLACRALQNLFDLSGRARDRRALKLRPEEVLRRGLLAYYKWAMMDAGLLRVDHIPVLCIGTMAPHESVDSIVGRVTDQLYDLGRQYRRKFFEGKDPVTGKPVFTRELPTIYGVIITKTIVTFLTYDARYVKKMVQTMGVYDFSKQDQDVWHAFAAAIIMIKARNYLLTLKEENLLGAELEDEGSDYDA